jgi:hypothetical protein
MKRHQAGLKTRLYEEPAGYSFLFTTSHSYAAVRRTGPTRRIGRCLALAHSLQCRPKVADRPRVIVALPDPVEGAAVADWLSADGLEPVRRSTPEAAAGEMQRRAFDLLIAESTWAVGTILQTASRARNSLAPTILIGKAIDRRSTAVNAQTMYMTRPIERAVLSCFVSMALIDDRPVRRSPRKTVHRFDALVNGVPSGILDVSVEGLRLEVPRDRRAVLPPYFAVRVPLVGVAIIAQRMWTRSSSMRPSTVWCGAALSHNRASSEEAWRSFVDTVPMIRETELHVNP